MRTNVSNRTALGLQLRVQATWNSQEILEGSNYDCKHEALKHKRNQLAPQLVPSIAENHSIRQFEYGPAKHQAQKGNDERTENALYQRSNDEIARNPYNSGDVPFVGLTRFRQSQNDLPRFLGPIVT